jgi:hypothetical protein
LFKLSLLEEDAAKPLQLSLESAALEYIIDAQPLTSSTL